MSGHHEPVGERQGRQPAQDSPSAAKIERLGNAAMANCLVLQARRYFRIADSLRRAAS